MTTPRFDTRRRNVPVRTDNRHRNRDRKYAGSGVLPACGHHRHRRVDKEFDATDAVQNRVPEERSEAAARRRRRRREQPVAHVPAYREYDVDPRHHLALQRHARQRRGRDLSWAILWVIVPSVAFFCRLAAGTACVRILARPARRFRCDRRQLWRLGVGRAAAWFRPLVAAREPFRRRRSPPKRGIQNQRVHDQHPQREDDPTVRQPGHPFPRLHRKHATGAAYRRPGPIRVDQPSGWEYPLRPQAQVAPRARARERRRASPPAARPSTIRTGAP
jgi:hypothetical protein